MSELTESRFREDFSFSISGFLGFIDFSRDGTFQKMLFRIRRAFQEVNEKLSNEHINYHEKNEFTKI
jgi:hypothetical protein